MIYILKKILNGSKCRRAGGAKRAGPNSVSAGREAKFERADGWGPPVSGSSLTETVRDRGIKIERPGFIVLNATGRARTERRAEQGEKSAAHLGLAGPVEVVWAMEVLPLLHLEPVATAGASCSGGMVHSTATAPSGGLRSLRYLHRTKRGS